MGHDVLFVMGADIDIDTHHFAVIDFTAVLKNGEHRSAEDQRAAGDHCDRIFVENFAPCWPEFDIEEHTGVKISKGIYQQDIGDTDTCPYIFYGYSVNADGLVSSCFLDWGRKLVIGDVRRQSMKEIWNSERMNALRLQHLEGRRRQNGVCGNCGQLSHCLPDNIDAHRLPLLEKFKKLVPLDPNIEPPGGVNRTFSAVAAE